MGDNILLLSNQEKFILKAKTYRIFQAIPNFPFFINPAVKGVQDRRRPKNGIFIGIPNSIKSFVTGVSPCHWWVPAVIISSQQSRILLINKSFDIAML